MKISRVLFGFILAAIFLICFCIIIFTSSPNIAIAAFTTVSFLVFVVYFGHVFLNLEINSKYISIRKRVLDLENKHKQLSKLSTTLSKLSILTKYQTIYPLEFDKNIEVSEQLINEIKQFINPKELDEFEKELKESNKRFRNG